MKVPDKSAKEEVSKMRLRAKKAQSVLEYTIILAAIIAAIIGASLAFQNQVGKSMTDANTVMNNSTGALTAIAP